VNSFVEFDKDGRIIVPPGAVAEKSEKKVVDSDRKLFMGDDDSYSTEEKTNSAVIAFEDKTPKKASWNLYKQRESDETYSKSKAVGGIFDYDGEKMDPLKFSNGKTQENILQEVMAAVNAGIKLIFIKGACGSGKSAIALNLAKHFKKTSIVVPIKNLQDQYERDYTGKNFILKEDGKRLKISVIKGRGNFPCVFSRGKTAADTTLPCDIELREKNMAKILEYIEQNEEVKKEDFSSISDVRRVSVAAACPYWSPILPAETAGKVLSKAKKRKFMTISGKEYALFQRAKGCGYYDQYNAYIDSDVLIFNSQKYLLETAIGRKPKTDLDVIDECDEFLDSFANEKKLNLNRFISALNNLMPEKDTDKHIIKDLILTANSAIAHYHEGLDKLAVSPLYSLFKKVLDNPYLAEEEDNNYYNTVFESVKSFESIIDETYVAYEKSGKDENQQGLFSYGGNANETVSANLVTINIGKRFKELIAMNNVFVLMSGTLHSEQVLKDVFGLENFRIIEAESKSPGFVSKIRTGHEKACSYENFKSGVFTRKDYLKAFSACVKKAKSPLLVHVSAFSDLPTDLEKKQYELDNLLSKEELYRLQDDDKLVEKFKSGKINVLFSTRCSRGVDFPGEQCNSIILTKYPYPNIQGIFWRILKEEQPTKFKEFYMDKARRELVQKVARGVRFKNDHVLLFSPDSRVLDAKVD
jgi:Rad3-related DNA helicase